MIMASEEAPSTLPDETQPDEDTPLLKAPEEQDWRPPRGFFWIELAIFSNVFLYGLDSTITAAVSILMGRTQMNHSKLHVAVRQMLTLLPINFQTYAVISSDFDAANTASWLTTSYLVTTTAFQPLYGRFSDIFGRRICFFVATMMFAIGCLGCGLATNVVFVNLMRAVTGFGGGGLMTMGLCYRKKR